jgi:phosphoribosyl 1,2-cyclic phosphate phosphodiesterase
VILYYQIVNIAVLSLDNSKTMDNKREIIFLGTAAALQLPSFHCSCDSCRQARNNPVLRKTRSSIAVKGNKIILIDAGPDTAFQMERESIRKIDYIFITHWHYDHVAGLGELGEPASIGKWDKIKLFLPEQDVTRFENELSYLKKIFNIEPVSPGFITEIDGIKFKAVKTNHSHDSLGYLIEYNKRFAYLVDGIRPPDETIEYLKNTDTLILEATMDELDEDWHNWDIRRAVDFWKETGIKECILTHMSFHSWKNGMLTAGFSESERKHIMRDNPGLLMAYDGMKSDL